jgi:PAS domain S-box-containing protein
LGYALGLASADLSAKVFWNKVQFLGAVIAPVAWLNYALRYAGHEKWLTRRRVVLLGLVPFITLLFAFTNEAHGLLWSQVTLNTDAPFLVLKETFGAWFWFFVVYAYALVLIGVFLLVQLVVRSRHLYRWQGSALLLGACVPWSASILDVFGLNPFPHFRPTSLAFVVTSLTVAWNLDRLQKEDIVPVARGTVVESMSDGVIVLDKQNRIIDLNPAAQNLFQGAVSEIIGQPVKQVWHEWPSEMALSRDEIEKGKEIAPGEAGDRRAYDVRTSPLTDWRGHVAGRVVVLRDITERKQAEEQIRASLEEKDVLLKEVHHRVKNNLQIVSSLLNLQSRSVADGATLEMFRDSQARVKSIALIHEKLYQSPDLARIDFAGYARDLVAHLFQSYQIHPGVIRLRIDVADVSPGLDTAIPCGLIINELVSNALKHAFPEDREGEIYVGLHLEDDQTVLTVSDDGIGLPVALDFLDTESLGLQLVVTLVKQLEGSIELDDGKGTAFKIAFTEPLREERS